jgi:prepilin-type N-terminal cleavage/methylation domain-containing protein
MSCKRHSDRSAAIHKQGFTLMELLVYMAIVGIVVVIAGEAFSNSTKFRVRTDNMIRATQEAENVGMLFKTDVEQLGTKSSKEAGVAASGAMYGDKFSDVHTSVYMDPANGDRSSFLITEESDGTSNLTFRRLRYDDNGYYVATEEVNWFVENRVLKRTCKLIDKKAGYTLPLNDPCVDVEETPSAMEMATQVDSFQVIPATPSVADADVQVFPPTGFTEFNLVPRTGDSKYVFFKAENSAGVEGVGGTSITLSQFFSNYDNVTQSVLIESNQKINQAFAIKNETFPGGTPWNSLCADKGSIDLEARQEYEISFEVVSPGVTDPYATSAANRSLAFVPGVDHMAVGFRSIATGDVPKVEGKKLMDDFFFFPPLDATEGGGKRSMRFTVPQQINGVCLAFTFACFSPLVWQGKVTIRNLTVKKVASSNYKFPPEVPVFDAEANKTEKKNVKALKVVLQVSRGSKNNGPGESGKVSLVIPIPSNGEGD